MESTAELSKKCWGQGAVAAIKWTS